VSGHPVLPIRSVFHPSDFSWASEQAFAHALRIAVGARAQLTILHVGSPGTPAQWTDFPGVHPTLERWGLLPEGSTRDDVARTGLKVFKTFREGSDPAQAILRHLEREPADLVVLATERREGWARLLQRQVARPVARLSGAMTLFLPEGARSFVSVEEGKVGLGRILIPVGTDPRPQPAVAATVALLAALGVSAPEVTLLHAGGAATAPAVRHALAPDWRWRHEARPGNAVEVIARFAREWAPDLIAMTTRGHDGFLDAFRGSTTERMLDGAPCPVLVMPASTRILPAAYLQ
jgi:nucleotide-binding universal stress UspA family protein